MDASWVAYRDVNETQVVLGYEKAPPSAVGGWLVQHVDWVDLTFSHPHLSERITQSVRGLPQDDPFAVPERELLCTVLAQIIDAIDGEMSDLDAFSPNWNEEKPYANDVIVRIESSLFETADAPYLIAAGLDFLSTTALEQLRRLAYERKSLTVLMLVPEETATAALDEAMQRRHATSLHDVFVQVLEGREAPTSDDPLRWLPSPIAVPLAMSQHTVTALRRFTSVRAFVENTFKMLALIDIAPCSGQNAGERMNSAAAALGTKPLTLGSVMKRVEKSSAHLSQVFPKTMASLLDDDGARSPLMTDFLKFRNDDAHGTPFAEATYAKKVLEFRAQLDELIDALCTDCRAFSIVVPVEMDSTDDGEIAYQVADLSGNRMVPPISRTVSTALLKKGRAYLQIEERFIDLDPVFRFHACPKCEFEELFMLDKPHNSTPSWSSGRNHPLEPE